MEDSFIAFVLGQLCGVERLGCRAMFGAYGLYRGRTLFGIVSAGRLYLKTSGAAAAEHERRGMSPFRRGGPGALATFYGVPPDVLSDRQLLRGWVDTAASCATAFGEDESAGAISSDVGA